jgi:hypothetical protein
MSDQSTTLPRLVRELIWAISSLLGGLMVLPALVYLVGTRMFGAYKGSGSGIGAFYADFSHDLAKGELSAWVLAVGPLVLIAILRILLHSVPLPPGPWDKWFKKSPNNSDSIGAS